MKQKLEIGESYLCSTAWLDGDQVIISIERDADDVYSVYVSRNNEMVEVFASSEKKAWDIFDKMKKKYIGDSPHQEDLKKEVKNV